MSRGILVSWVFNFPVEPAADGELIGSWDVETVGRVDDDLGAERYGVPDGDVGQGFED